MTQQPGGRCARPQHPSVAIDEQNRIGKPLEERHLERRRERDGRRHQRFPLLGGGQNYYHTVHVKDLVRGLRLLGTHSRAVGEVFILGGESYLKLSELTALIASAAGVPAPWLRLPVRPFQLAGSLVEKICIPLGIEPPIYRRRVDFFTKSRAFSIEKARRLLGYRPEVKLADGIRETMDWYVAHGHLQPNAHLEAAYQQ